MSKRTIYLFLIPAPIAVALSGFLFWLSTEFRPNGILWILQQLLTYFFIIPYVVGGAIGSNPYVSQGVVFLAVLFVEFYALTLLIMFLVLKLKARYK